MRWIVVALAAVVAWTVAPAMAQAPMPRAGSTLTIGTVLPDTGPLSAYGPATQAAVRLAVDDANAAGGVLGAPVTLRPGDSGDVGSGVFARTLAALADAQSVIGPLSSALVLEDVSVAKGRGLISPAAVSPRLTGTLARTVPAQPLGGRMLVQLAWERGATRLVVVGGPDQRALIDAALDRASALGLSATSVAYARQDSATRTAIRVVRAGADAMLLATGTQTTPILRELLPRGMPGKVLLTPEAAAAVVPRDLPRAALEGALALELDLRVPDALARRIRTVVPAARVTAYSAQAYDAAALAILAAESAGRVGGAVTAAGIRAALPGVTTSGTACTQLARCLRLLRRGDDIDYVGYAGPFALDAQGDPGRARYLVRVIGVDNRPGASIREVRYP